MGTVLESLIIIACIISIVTNSIYLFSVKKLNRAAKKTLQEIPQSLQEVKKDTVNILQYCFDLKADISSIQEKQPSLASQQPQAPIRPNNWESMREAFKGPARVDINE